jgi:hypothetical protein
MTNTRSPTPLWTTSSLGLAADTSPLELTALGHHLAHCQGSNGHLFTLQCAAQTMTGFATARFVTTMLAFAVLAGAVFLVL